MPTFFFIQHWTHSLNSLLVIRTPKRIKSSMVFFFQAADNRGPINPMPIIVYTTKRQNVFFNLYFNFNFQSFMLSWDIFWCLKVPPSNKSFELNLWWYTEWIMFNFRTVLHNLTKWKLLLWNSFVIFNYITFPQQVMFIACELQFVKKKWPEDWATFNFIFILKILVESREIAGCQEFFFNSKFALAPLGLV